MIIRKFEGETLEHTLDKVKRELGGSALVLSTKKKSGGWFKKEVVEITAGVHTEEASESNESYAFEELDKIFPHRKNAGNVVEEPKVRVNKTSNELGVIFRGNKKNTKAKVEKPTSQVREAGYQRHVQQFERLGLHPSLSVELGKRLFYDFPIEDLNDKSMCERAMAKIMVESMQVLDLERILSTRQIYLWGSDGVGKTSSAIKLALFLKKHGLNASLCSIEERKLLGAGELRKYSKLLQLPFRRFGEFEAGEVLITDTGSELHRSPSQRMVFGEVSALHLLVLDCQTRVEEMISQYSRFQHVKLEGIIFTKLDNSQALGVLYEFLKRTRIACAGVSDSKHFRDGFRYMEVLPLAQQILHPKRRLCNQE